MAFDINQPHAIIVGDGTPAHYQQNGNYYDRNGVLLPSAPAFDALRDTMLAKHAEEHRRMGNVVEFSKGVTGKSVFSAGGINDSVGVVVGDSRMAQHFNTNGTGTMRYNTGPLHFARGCGSTKFRFGAAQCFAVSGKRTDEYADQMPAALALYPAFALIFGFMNDVAQLTSFYGSDVTLCATTAVNNLVAYAKQFIGIGTRPILMTDYSGTSMTAAQRQAVLLGNSLLRQAAQANPLISLVDTTKYMIDPMNTTFTALTAMLQGDGNHLSPRAAYYLGRYELAPIIAQVVPKIPYGLCTSAAETHTNDPKTWNANPLWLTRNTGTYGAGVTTHANGDGVTAAGASGSATSGVPAGCDVSVSGTGTIAFDLPVGTYGYKPTMVCSYTGAGVESRFKWDAFAHASLVGGERIIVEGKITVTNPVNMANVKSYLELNNGATSQVADMQIWAGNIAGPDETYTFYFETEEMTVPTGGGMAWFNAHIRAMSSGTGTATIVVESCRARQVN